jgi:hypothetical protein
MLTRKGYVKHNSLMLVQGNVERVKKLGVRNCVTLRVTLWLVTLPLVMLQQVLQGLPPVTLFGT